MSFFNTFRGRLLLILLFLLVTTLGVQYYLNLLTQRENDARRETQERITVAGFTVGIISITSEARLQDLITQSPEAFLDEAARARIKDILVIDNERRISDSLSDTYLPTTDDAGNAVYLNLQDLTDLPPLMEASRLGDDTKYFPNAHPETTAKSDDEAHVIPVETSQGRWYVMVLLRSEKGAAAWRAARSSLRSASCLSLRWLPFTSSGDSHVR